MKPAREWATEFLSKHVLNTRESGEFERFVTNIQKDALDEASKLGYKYYNAGDLAAEEIIALKNKI